MDSARRLGDYVYPLSAFIAALGVAALGAAALIFVLRSNPAAPTQRLDPQSEGQQLSDEE